MFMVLCLQYPEHGFYGIQDKLLLFRHDQTDPNVLKLISTFTEVTEGTLVEVVLSGKLSPGGFIYFARILYVGFVYLLFININVLLPEF